MLYIAYVAYFVSIFSLSHVSALSDVQSYYELVVNGPDYHSKRYAHSAGPVKKVKESSEALLFSNIIWNRETRNMDTIQLFTVHIFLQIGTSLVVQISAFWLVWVSSSMILGSFLTHRVFYKTCSGRKCEKSAPK